MKKLFIVLAMFALVGVGVAALWFFHVPPFGRPKKDDKALALKPGKNKTMVASVAPPASAPVSPPPVVVTPVATPPVRETIKTAPPPAPKVSESDLNRLAGVYEQMPVDEATKIMAKLPDTVVEPLLRRMDERQVGKLLTTFTPDRAAKLTLAMAKSSAPAIAPP